MHVDDSSDWPSDYRPTAEDGPFTLAVDGEVFTVEVRADGGSSYNWDSGPNEGYGMDSSHPMAAGRPDVVVQPLTMAQHIKTVRNFLSAIDRETGYLGD
ncbi:hypothetical protein SAMN05421642_11749 [Rhodococcoides kyotonense]|uniref:Uncharacterized protein n=1 Tax=Rhodococcoides kyotonense TaxID=398843 RepID=A0A239MBX2_9NOCA|nr:hypothetical protein SAMN05421642_11749 [Rhodococcus kyotonensis]